MPDSVRVTQEDAVLRIEIDRQARRNALNAEVAEGIVAGLEQAEGSGTRVIILTGAGERAFCAGGDMARGADGAPFTMDPADPNHYVVGLLRTIDRCRLPVVARVNGHALAGGFGLLCACDLAVAAEDATFGVPEVGVGLFPMMILPHLLRVVPYRPLMEMCLTGQPIDARAALALGIVNRVTSRDRLDAETDALVARLVEVSPSGTRLGKQGLRALREMGFDAALEYAQLMLPIMAQTADAREGFAAFNEKRRPVWTGR